MRPFEAASKVFIIDKAHLLKDEAANSILKILEEPPKDSYIILITDNLEKVFDTIRSRCQPIPFLSATPDALEELLKTDYSLTAQEAHFLARLAEGRIGSALKMKREDTLSWKNQVIDLFTQENIIVHQDPLFYNNKREELLGLIDILVGWCRDLFMLKNNVDQRLLVNVDRLQELNEKAHSFPTKEVRVMLEETLKTRAYIEENVNPKLALANLACQWYR